MTPSSSGDTPGRRRCHGHVPSSAPQSSVLFLIERHLLRCTGPPESEATQGRQGRGPERKRAPRTGRPHAPREPSHVCPGHRLPGEGVTAPMPFSGCCLGTPRWTQCGRDQGRGDPPGTSRGEVPSILCKEEMKLNQPQESQKHMKRQKLSHSKTLDKARNKDEQFSTPFP